MNIRELIDETRETIERPTDEQIKAPNEEPMDYIKQNFSDFRIREISELEALQRRSRFRLVTDN